MIRTSSHPRRRSLRAPLVALVALLALAFTASAAQAAPQTVVGGHLTWSTVNMFQGSVATENRTALGFFTRSVNAQGQLRGTVSPLDAAWGDIVTPLSTKGPDQNASWTFPVAAGSYDPVAKTGRVKLLGTVQWAGQHPTTDAPFKVTVENPVVVFDGTGIAKLYASGTGATGAGVETPYTQSTPLFTLDFTGATTTDEADGSETLGNAIPTLARTDVFFGYTSTGPDRTPNTWGGFSLNLVTPQTGPKGDTGEAGTNGTNGTDGAAGANGTNGTNGTNGKDGKDGAAGAKGEKGDTGSTRVIAVLRKAPFSGNATRKVTLLKNGKTVASGTLKKKTLTVTVAKGKKVSAGTYVVKAGSAKKTVKIG